MQQVTRKTRDYKPGSEDINLQHKTALSHSNRKEFVINFDGGTLDLGHRTYIMGILNVTPDSFSDGNVYFDSEKALDRACEMVEEGADIIDIGGESTRPGAGELPVDEELNRVIPVIEKIAKKIETPISIDTYKAEVACRAMEAGAHIINDISGLRFDRRMADVAVKANCPLILMHIKGTPTDMQLNPGYDCVMPEVIHSLKESIDIAVKAGVDPDKVIVDPGIGFGKRLDDNLTIIKHLEELKTLGKAILVGPSRKSFIGSLLGIPNPEERLEGTLSASVIAAVKGAHIVRVHDVKESHRALAVADAILMI